MACCGCSPRWAASCTSTAARPRSRPTPSGAASGVRLEDGRHFPAEVVVSNGDVANTYRKLAPGGAAAQMDGPAARTDAVFDGIVRRVFRHGPDLPASGSSHDHPHATLQGTACTTSSTASISRTIFRFICTRRPGPTRVWLPPGGECFYVLSPVPNLLGKIGLGTGQGTLRRRDPRLARTSGTLPRPAAAHRHAAHHDAAGFRDRPGCLSRAARSSSSRS